MIIATLYGRLLLLNIPSVITALRFITDCIDRSNWPHIITIVSPIAIMAERFVVLRSEFRLNALKKFGANNVANRNITTNII